MVDKNTKIPYEDDLYKVKLSEKLNGVIKEQDYFGIVQRATKLKQHKDERAMKCIEGQLD